MRIPGLAALPRVFAALALLSIPTACGGSNSSSGDAKADGKTPAADAKGDAAADGKAAADGEAAADGANAAASSGAVPPTTAADGAEAGADAAGGSGGAGSGGAGSGGAGSGGADSGGADPGGTDTGGGDAAGDDAAGSDTGSVDLPALYKELKRTKTSDERAMEILAEAEAAGAEASDLAKNANYRGEALFATPERAKVFFEWAADKYPKAYNATFNLAKQAAMLGELDDAKKWLTETKNRGGKKLLAQIEFDPQWEILKDDPDVRALLR